MTTWRPHVRSGDAPLYQRLVDALRADLVSGQLAAGTRLPTQRELAEALGISPGTVTKAYTEAAHQGIVHGKVGRGTFVSSSPLLNGRSDSSVIDLSLNLPGPKLPAGDLAEGLRRVARGADFSEFLGYTTHVGLPKHRRVLADWLNANGFAANADNLVLCNGAQHAMALCFAVLCKPDDTILTEAATYHGMKTLADCAGYRLLGLAMDDEGLIPEELDKACRAGTARVLFTMPTLQNPTARTMSLARRQQIVSVARDHNILIVEDDVHSFLERTQPPLATLAPERVFHISSIAKCMPPGLRVGTLVAPNRFQAALERHIRATCWMTSPISAAIACDWIEQGLAEALVQSLREEIGRRVELAKRILGALIRSDHPPSLHIWLNVSALAAERAANGARHRGVIVTPPGAPIVDSELISGMRVSVGAPPTTDRLETGLVRLRAAFEDKSGTDLSII